MWLINNWEFLLSLGVSVWELIARIRPTEKNYSILDNLYLVYSTLVPNNLRLDKSEFKGKKGLYKISKEIKELSK